MAIHTLADLAQLLEGEVRGDPNCRIRKIASIAQAKAGEMTFLADLRYKSDLQATQASAVLLEPKWADACSKDRLIVPNVKLALARLMTLFFKQDVNSYCSPGIHSTAVIGVDSVIHPDASIGPYVVIGSGVTIGVGAVIGSGSCLGDRVVVGEASRLYDRVTVYAGIQIGKRAVIHSGAIIGADGFGFTPDERGEWIKMPQFGSVVISDDVEIGANTTIDRGMLDDTKIANGVKLDNLVMVAHNVQIGSNTAIAGATTIGGSVVIGRHCVFGGHATIKDHVTICDGVQLGGCSKVIKSITVPGVYSSGAGVLMRHREAIKQDVYYRQLGQLIQRVKKLEEKL